MVQFLEWFCFIGSLFSVWFYGKNTEAGPLIGILVSIGFIFFGFFSGILAAIIANFAFLILHTKNLILFKKNNVRKIKKGKKFTSGKKY